MAAVHDLHGLMKPYLPMLPGRISKMLKFIEILPKNWTRRLIHGQGLLRNPYTLGVRVIVEDLQGRILLVRHSYLKGWYLPGGAVEAGETLHEAACREVLEETGVCADGAATLLNIYLNDRGWGRDHVGLFHLTDWSKSAAFLQPNREIAEADFFEFDDLPADTTGATVGRLREFRNGVIPPGGRWSSADGS